MPREIKRLTVVQIKRLRKPGRHADGDGLYLNISPAGARSWIFRYRHRGTGRHREMGLGPERDITLERARQRARDARDLLREGKDPLDVKGTRRADQAAAHAKRMTFRECRDSYIESHGAAWSNEKHRAQWVNTLETYAAHLLPMQVADIDTPHVLTALRPIWSVKTETAKRVQGRIKDILDLAIAAKLRAGPNPALWDGHLDKFLPPPTKVRRVKHRAALPYDELPEFMRELRALKGLAPRSLELQILTATRPGEVVAAQWHEIDLEKAIWTIPEERMKARKAHRIPLSGDAVKLLTNLLRVRGESAVFPGRSNNRALTTAAPMKALKALRPGLTAHGFRSSFRDWAADKTHYPREVAEQALAHTIKDKSEAAYRRTDIFEKRTALMTDWAAFCNSNPGTNTKSGKEAT